MGKSTISMAIFHCYVSSPEGRNLNFRDPSTILHQALFKKKIAAFHFGPHPGDKSLGPSCKCCPEVARRKDPGNLGRLATMTYNGYIMGYA